MSRGVETCLLNHTTGAKLSDRDILARFVRQREEAAFQLIVERYGALVLGVCLRVLHDRHAAEDAFQATFLVLSRKAHAIRKRHALANWLHGVARRISLRMLRLQDRRSEQSLSHEPVMETSPIDSVGLLWEQQILDEELQSLPENWREALLLHELEELSCQAAADRIGISVTALEGRLKRGKRELKHRLLRRGLGVGAILTGVQSAQAAGFTQPGTELILLTVRAGLAPPATPALTPSPTSPLNLAQQELLAMSTLKTTSVLTIAGSLFLAAGLAGGGWLASHQAQDYEGSSAFSTLQPDDGALAGKGAAAQDRRSRAITLEHVHTVAHHEPQLSLAGGEDRTTFIRRVTRDLTGMEPKPQEIKAFLDDPRPFAEAAADLVKKLAAATPERMDSAQRSELGTPFDPFQASLTADGGHRIADPLATVNREGWSLDYHAANPAETKISTALDNSVDLELIDTELQQALMFFADQQQIPIVWDESAWEAAGVSPETTINLVLAGISLRNALNRILRPLELDYVIRDDVLEITSRKAADQLLETRVYELRMLPEEIRPEDLARVIVRSIQPESWGENPWVYIQPTPMKSESGFGTGGRGRQATSGASSYESAHGATAGGDPYGAGEEGGASGAEMMLGGSPGNAKPIPADRKLAAVETLPGCLVVTQSQRAHREIERLLQQLHRRPADRNPAPLNPHPAY